MGCARASSTSRREPRSFQLELRQTARIASLVLACTACTACSNATVARDAQRADAEPAVVVPKIWDAEQLATWATPLAGLGVPPSYATEEQYYAAPVDNLRTYPLYHPSREPAGYREWMLKQGPQPLIEPSKLKTHADWIAAGQRVFEELDTAASRSDDPAVLAYFSDAKSVDAHRDAGHDVMTRDGVLLDYRWVVDRDGKLEVSFSSCFACHTRLMPDGSLLAGAPCNYDLGDSPAADVLLRNIELSHGISAGEDLYAQLGVPWLADDPHAGFKTMPDKQVHEFFAQDDGAPPGTTFARFNGSPLSVTRMADLRGVRDRRYLDATGTHLNRGPEDIARYGILVEFVDIAVFGPHHMLPPDARPIRCRPPDEAMYAMALYLYSLDPAPSPHPFDALAQRGREVFEQEDCAECHPAPLYTNNELMKLARVGTDPGLTLRTRKGTGYYKVPSLRGLWYRGLFEHNGSLSSLDDWFDRKRLDPGYVPTGWRGPGVKTRAVPGHEFGLDLSDADKRALIAFLETL